LRHYIDDLGQHVGQTLELRGWVYNTRASKKVKFLELRDGTGMVQCVFFKGHCSEEAFEKFSELTQECTVTVKGVVQANPKKPGVYEIGAESFSILNPSTDYPITPKDHGIDFLMNIFTPNACEGTSTLFSTKYFDEQAYLSQSGQLYMEATAAALGKVYCFGPTFRAEKSKTRRHLIEFWMVEPEVAFNDLYDNMDLAEQFVEYIVQRTIKNRAQELAILGRDLSKLASVKAPFPRVHYQEAVEIIKKENPDFVDGDDFGGTDETIISSKYGRPVFVHHFPTAIKAFYMKQDPDNPKYSLSCDLLGTEGYGELIGGGQREDSLEILERKIIEHELNLDDFSWYRDLRRYGSFPHSGFGLGLERTVAWICGIPHVRETIPFPRLYGRLHP